MFNIGKKQKHIEPVNIEHLLQSLYSKRMQTSVQTQKLSLNLSM